MWAQFKQVATRPKYNFAKTDKFDFVSDKGEAADIWEKAKSAVYDAVRIFGARADVYEESIGPFDVGISKHEFRAVYRVQGADNNAIATLSQQSVKFSSGPDICWDGSCFGTSQILFADKNREASYRIGINVRSALDIQIATQYSESSIFRSNGIALKSTFMVESRLTDRYLTISGGIAIPILLKYFIQKYAPVFSTQPIWGY